MAGIVLLALGPKKALEYVGDEQAHALSDPLKGIALAALVGGVVMHLLAQAGFRWWTTGRFDPVLPVAAVLIAPFGWLGAALPTLAAVTAITVAVVAFDATRPGHR